MFTALILTLCMTLTLVTCDDHDLYEATTRAGQRIWRQVAGGQNSLVLSPLGIHMNLCMAAAGARGTTLDEIKNVTKIISFDRFGKSCDAQYLTLNQNVASYTGSKVYIANTILIPFSSTFRPAFNITLRLSYQTYGIAQTYASDQDIKSVNQLVKAATRNLVSEFFPQPVLFGNGFSYDSSSTFLLNLCVINATWLKPFPKQRTKKRTFTAANGTVVQFEFINDVRECRMRRNFRRADIVELALTGGNISFYIVKPRFWQDIQTLESYLTSPGTVYNVTAGPFENVMLNFSLPKFKLDSYYKLKVALTNLGINLAFDDNQANNSAIAAGYPDIPGLITVLGGVKGWKDVYTRSLIEINEVGTVINATGTVTNETLPAATTPPLEEFNCNTPFLFYFIDKVTKVILMQGKLGG